MKRAASSPFASVQEWDDPFLALWLHRFDFLWAEHPQPGAQPDWQTETRYPLSDRLIQQGAYLYGVRFGKVTRYLMLDIDAGSLYHPQTDPLAIGRLVGVLEPLDLVTWVAVRSSYSGGIHLYFPFAEAQESWAIALAASMLLEHAGFKLAPGQLELFPNPRPYSESPSLYLGHRLPMQAGSYLLNVDFQPMFGDQSRFVQQWQQAEHRNLLKQATLKRVLKKVQRKRYRISKRAAKFLNDLNAEVEAGWSGSGQTNRLLGRIAMREYIFGHVQYGGDPLSGNALVNAICEVARSLPGFQDYCNHQSELEKRAQQYARSVEASRYYPFGYKSGLRVTPAKPAEPEAIQPSWNQKQSLAARDRICQAVADLLSKEQLPSQPTARKNAIKRYGIGSTTLDKYPELWHPHHLKLAQGGKDHPVETNMSSPKSLETAQGGEDHPNTPNKLVTCSAAPQGQAGEFRKVGGSGGFSTALSAPWTLQRPKALAHLAKMQKWLASGDVILVAEAQQFFAEAKADAG